MAKQFTTEVIVTQQDLDELQHVNNVRYLQWVQDVAKAHWEGLAPSGMQDHYVWVVVNHFIEYKGEAKDGDQLKINTYIEESKGVTSVRIVEIHKGEKLITKAKTTWCLLDVGTRKPTRIPETIAQLFE